MNRRVCTVLLVAVLSVGSVVAAGEPKEEAPALLYGRGADPSASPVWVSAEAAATDSGELDWALLGSQAHQMYQAILRSTPPLLAKPPGDDSPPEYDPDSSGLRPDCAYYGAAYFDPVERLPSETIQDVIRNARAAVRGRVVAVTPGFYLGEPNSLLTVSIERVLRSSSDLSRGHQIHVIYPQAQFSVGEAKFCKGDSEFPYRPQVGDSVMVFPFRPPRDRSGTLILPGPKELFFARPDGELVLPGRFARGTGEIQSLDALEERVREVIK